MKFIHFADAHLDSPFLGLSFLPSESFKQIQNAPMQSLTKIVDLALKEKVDLVLIAGDTFDSFKPTPSVQIFFAHEIERLVNAKIQVIMIFGNHDHMAKEDLLVAESPYFKLLGNGEKVETVSYKTKNGFEYDVSGFSYLANHITDDMAAQFPAKSSRYTFGIMHAQERAGASAQNVYAPFSLSELQNLNYNYFALGHIHLRQVLSETPLIVYPGNIQGRHINETGPKGCYLGTIDEQTKQTKIHFMRTNSITWSKKELELTKPVAKTELENMIIDCLSAISTTYFCLQIKGADFLNEKEKELVQDNDFWQMISRRLTHDSQLVDVRFISGANLEIAFNDQKYFKQAEKEVFGPDQFAQISKSWALKTEYTDSLAQDPEFVQEVKQLSEVKLNSKLKGVNDEIN
ncbi:DNA repair exonuclease [Lactobacillus kullabergensis]|uniref:metallophosphoesterase family protein n=1 Tax=Lactobacillus kullabergensis TaxID=1218493 RepID=UPI002245ACE3|nr:DNA repair exonuclease [Lactobacillus kullabergensis]MCX0290242.1 DNA repair exonuclease [Lactobacillus kullabergensis]